MAIVMAWLWLSILLILKFGPLCDSHGACGGDIYNDTIRQELICYWTTSVATQKALTAYQCYTDGKGKPALIPNNAAFTVAYEQWLNGPNYESGYPIYLGYTEIGSTVYMPVGSIQDLNFWAPGKPDDPDASCVAMRSDGLWRDVYCYSELKALCESTIYTATPTQQFDVCSTSTYIPETCLSSAAVAVTSYVNDTCPCSWRLGENLYEVNMTKELLEQIEKLKRELLIDRKTLSAYKIKKLSAKDTRPSAITAGYLGIIVMVLIFGGLLVWDLPMLYSDIKGQILRFKKDDS